MVKEEQSELFYRIALTQIEQVGDKTGRQLLHRFGTADRIFHASFRQLESISGLGAKKVAHLKDIIDEAKIAAEINFMHQHDIRPVFITDQDYPEKLKNCADAPLMLYYKGKADLNTRKIVAIIGTRKNTEYGMRMTEELVEGLRGQDVIIVSGLAFGIDIIAHRKAVQLQIPTIGVMAHGLDTIYPSQHKHITREMVKNGGLLTEYMTGTQPDKFNFPMRNRIVAGMADVTVVVETESRGGAMITAKLAAGYNREVAAFPGRVIDKKSEGCNYLIRTNIAQQIGHVQDLLDMMNWQRSNRQAVAQTRLFPVLNTEESMVAGILAGSEGMHIDELLLKAGVHTTTLSSLLLTLELNGMVKALPGKRYRLV